MWTLFCKNAVELTIVQNRRLRQDMNVFRNLPIILAFLLFGGGCTEFHPSSAPYHPQAYRPKDPNHVIVKVSLCKQMVYVMEGQKPLLITACSVGLPNKPTPRGRFVVTEKIAQKRSGAYGFYVRGSEIVPASVNKRPVGSGWHYIGYPMPYWVGFSPGYGFHEGDVWPVPRTHGCIRLHKNAAPNFYALVRAGTPVIILENQPEDLLYASQHTRPVDYLLPDPPNALLISPECFNRITAACLIDG